jgi:sulfur carrier protein ThiS
MFIAVNGQPHPPGAANEEVVLRGSFEDYWIRPGDKIDIVHPTAGG